MGTPSHFTKLRLLKILSLIQYQKRPIGAGYENIEKLVEILKTIGTSESDVQNSISNLTKKGLVENDLHTQKYLNQAKAIRITPTGAYYLEYLCNQFTYLDLMQQDTPILGEETYDILNHYAESTAMSGRFKRCNAFVDYLFTEEENELSTIKKITTDDFLTQSFMPTIKEEYDKNISKVQIKLSRLNLID